MLSEIFCLFIAVHVKLGLPLGSHRTQHTSYMYGTCTCMLYVRKGLGIFFHVHVHVHVCADHTLECGLCTCTSCT